MFRKAKKQFIDYLSDGVPVETAVVDAGAICTDVLTGNEYLFDGSTWREYKMKYKDLGLVIDAVNVAAGAIIACTLPNVMWVRSVIAMVNMDQGYDLTFTKYDSSDFEAVNGPTTIVAAQPLSAGAFRQHVAITDKAILGKKVRFILKNNGSVATTYARLRLQLLGL